jgi:hypothetical protein
MYKIRIFIFLLLMPISIFGQVATNHLLLAELKEFNKAIIFRMTYNQGFESEIFKIFGSLNLSYPETEEAIFSIYKRKDYQHLIFDYFDNLFFQITGIKEGGIIKDGKLFGKSDFLYSYFTKDMFLKSQLSLKLISYINNKQYTYPKVAYKTKISSITKYPLKSKNEILTETSLVRGAQREFDVDFYKDHKFLYGKILSVSSNFNIVEIEVAKCENDFINNFRDIKGEKWKIYIEQTMPDEINEMNLKDFRLLQSILKVNNKIKFSMVEGYPGGGTAWNGMWFFNYIETTAKK